MISNLIIKRTQALSQIAYKTFFYNLNYLPDTILGGIILFALLLQSPPLLVLGVLLMMVEFLHVGISNYFASVVSGTIEASKDAMRCSGHFPGISFERLISMAQQTGSLSILSNGFPSYYMLFMGTLFGYILGMGYTYEKEIEGMPQKRMAVYSGLYIMGVLGIMLIIIRNTSECDSLISILLGSAIGLIFGFLMEVLIAFLSERRLTNLMNIPLIRNRAEDGKPIYVCAKQQE
jgi:hypothetical protein